MNRNRWQRKLVEGGVKNLHEFGYPTCTADNLMTGPVFAPMFASMLKDNRGISEDYDEAIDALLKEIGS